MKQSQDAIPGSLQRGVRALAPAWIGLLVGSAFSFMVGVNPGPSVGMMFGMIFAVVILKFKRVL